MQVTRHRLCCLPPGRTHLPIKEGMRTGGALGGGSGQPELPHAGPAAFLLGGVGSGREGGCPAVLKEEAWEGRLCPLSHWLVASVRGALWAWPAVRCWQHMGGCWHGRGSWWRSGAVESGHGGGGGHSMPPWRARLPPTPRPRALVLWVPFPSLGAAGSVWEDCRAHACEIRWQQGLGPSRRGPRQFDLGLAPTERVEATPSSQDCGARAQLGLEKAGGRLREGLWAAATRGRAWARGVRPGCRAGCPPARGKVTREGAPCGAGGEAQPQPQPQATPCRAAGCPAEGALAPPIPRSLFFLVIDCLISCLCERKQISSNLQQ